MGRSKQPTIAVYDTVANAAAAVSGMTAGTIVITTTAPGNAFVVKLNGSTRTLAPIDASGVLGPWVARLLSLAGVNGAPASGVITYTATVINDAAAPVPGALVFVGAQRTAGAGAGTLAVLTGTVVSLLDVGGGAIAAVVQCNNAGVAVWTLTGTAGDTWTVNAGTDAPEGGSVDSEAGRVLP